MWPNTLPFHKHAKNNIKYYMGCPGVPLCTRVEGPCIPFPGPPPHKRTLRGSGRVPVGHLKGGSGIRGQLPKKIDFCMAEPMFSQVQWQFCKLQMWPKTLSFPKHQILHGVSWGTLGYLGRGSLYTLPGGPPHN